MSTPPKDPNRKRVTLTKLAEMRALGEPIVMITAYDHPSALIVEEAGVDVVLVGDSAADNVLGYSDTVPVTVEELLMLTRAVRRGLNSALLVGDLPFGSYEASDAQAIEVRQTAGIKIGVDRMRECGFAGAVMSERKQVDHCAAGLLLTLLGQQHLECAGISAAREQLIAVDQIEQRHRFLAQRMDDVMVVDDVAVLTAPLRRPTTPQGQELRGAEEAL